MQAQCGEQPAVKDLESKEDRTDHSIEEKGKKSEAEPSSVPRPDY